MSIFRSLGVSTTPNLSAIAPHKLDPRSTRCVFTVYSLDHKGYCCIDLSTNHVVISQHVVFDEVYFPFTASPPLTNDYEFLSEMDPVLSPIGTCLNAGTPVTTVGGLTAPSSSLTAPIVEVGGLTTRPTGGPSTPYGGLTMPPSGLTARIVEAGWQTAP
jgi:hypothetical protein